MADRIEELPLLQPVEEIFFDRYYADSANLTPSHCDCVGGWLLRDTTVRGTGAHDAIKGEKS